MTFRTYLRTAVFAGLLISTIASAGCAVANTPPVAAASAEAGSGSASVAKIEVRFANSRDVPQVRALALRISPEARLFLNGMGYTTSVGDMPAAIDNKYLRTQNNDLYVYLYVDDETAQTMTVADIAANIRVMTNAVRLAKAPPDRVWIYIVVNETF